MQAWSSFAKTGNPGWARYEAKDKIIKNFDSEDSLRFAKNLMFIKGLTNFLLAPETIPTFKQDWRISSSFSACSHTLFESIENSLTRTQTPLSVE